MSAQPRNDSDKQQQQQQKHHHHHQQQQQQGRTSHGASDTQGMTTPYASSRGPQETGVGLPHSLEGDSQSPVDTVTGSNSPGNQTQPASTREAGSQAAIKSGPTEESANSSAEGNDFAEGSPKGRQLNESDENVSLQTQRNPTEPQYRPASPKAKGAQVSVPQLSSSDNDISKEETGPQNAPKKKKEEEEEEKEIALGSEQQDKEKQSASNGGGVFKEFVEFCRCHKGFIMSTTLVGGLSGALGMFFGAVMYQTLFGNQTTQVIVSDGGGSWEVLQAQLQETEKKIRLEYQKELQRKMDEFNDNFTKEMTSKTQTFVNTTLQKGIDDAKSDIKSVYDAKLTAMDDQHNKTIEKAMCDMEDTFSKKVKAERAETVKEVETRTASLKEQVDQRIELEPAVMDIHGFMNIYTYGPIMLILPLLEILVVWFCYTTFARRDPVRHRQNGPAVQNGQVVRARHEANRFEPINTGNRNIVLLCFRHDDEDVVNQWGEELLQSCNSTPKKYVHVIESLDDVTTIPPCRAALVFADPDEREMIIEDERHHIGQGLRRQAVQRLLDSGVEVFVIVYHDKNRNDLQTGQLYNRKLGQINEHAQLKRLKRENRVVSMKNSFQPWQRDHIVGQIQDILSQR